jgi:hypothetical protein
MSVQELPKVINWKINLKNGASIDLNIRDGDEYDLSIKKWVGKMAAGVKEYFNGAFELGEVWVSPEEFSMALRSPYRPPAPETTTDFAKVDKNDPEAT